MEAVDLVNGMMNPILSKRFSLNDVLNCEFINKKFKILSEVNSNKLSSNIKNFIKLDGFNKAINIFMTKITTKKDIDYISELFLQ